MNEIKRPLDKTELNYLRSLSGDAVDVIIALFRCLLGAEAWDTAESVNPRHVKIPKEQWLDLCRRSTVNKLQWMNVGPSCYD